MQPTARGSTSAGSEVAPPPPPPSRSYIPPPPAQIPGALIRSFTPSPAQIAAEQVAQNERNIAANNAASGQPVQQEGGCIELGQKGQQSHDAWQGTQSGQYQQPAWHAPLQFRQPNWHSPQQGTHTGQYQQPNWGGTHTGQHHQPMTTGAAAEHAENISSAQEGGSCWGI